MQPFDAISLLEKAAALDRPAAVLGQVGEVVIRGPRLRAALEGRPIGHAAHPMLVQMPIGAWVSAGLLDCLPGMQTSASFLTGIGVVSAVPAVAAGLADYRRMDPPQRRVGVVHAIANVVSLAFQVVSLRNRLGGRLRRGQWMGLAGTATLAFAGLLGGHIAHPMSSDD